MMQSKHSLILVRLFVDNIHHGVYRTHKQMTIPVPASSNTDLTYRRLLAPQLFSEYTQKMRRFSADGNDRFELDFSNVTVSDTTLRRLLKKKQIEELFGTKFFIDQSSFHVTQNLSSDYAYIYTSLLTENNVDADS